MQDVATLLTATSRADLTDRDAAAVRAAIAQSGATPIATQWLSPQIACDVVFTGANRGDVSAALRKTFADAAFDLVVQRRPGRRKDLLVADMDATIIAEETLDELAAVAGLRDRIAPITQRAMNGEIGFEEAMRLRVRMLEGVHVSQLESTFDRISMTPGARTLVQTMRAHGSYTLLLSGGFSYFTSRIRGAIGFDRDIGNDIAIEGDQLTGAIDGPVLAPGAKHAALVRIAAERHVPLSETLAVGDGANDIGMLQAAGLGVAYRPKPVVAAAVAVQLRHADLTGLLYLQGYSQQEFRR
ncbi:MAG: phosphoserine phosphatase SerB [Alphaproteobacteria bacterium]|nr:phosphoserine phosphatase SerB [Alphaproteobacteria bacterium]